MTVDDQTVKIWGLGIGILTAIVAGLRWVFIQGRNYQQIERTRTAVEEILKRDYVEWPELREHLEELESALKDLLRRECEEHKLRCDLERERKERASG